MPAPDDWAVCCSGGGIRSATYCLGALQCLAEGGLLGKAKWIVGVPGGSYIAASRALVARDLDRAGDGRFAYARGTPEEEHLRNNTQYLEPHRATVVAGALAVLLGTMVTFVLAVAPLYVLAHAWGWLLRWQGVLVPSGPRVLAAAAPGLAWWLPSVIAAGITVALLVLWRATLRSGGPGRGVRRARSVSWAAAFTAGLAIAMLAMPPLNAWLTKTKGLTGAVVHFIGFDVRPSRSLLLWAGLAAAVTVVGWYSHAGLATWNVLNGPATSKGAARKQPALLTWLTRWLRLRLLPGLASAAIVLGGVVLALRWTSDGARAGLSVGQFLLVLVALAVMFLTRTAVDVNGLSLHDVYRWRLADTYGVTRAAAQERNPRMRESLLARAARTRLSGLHGYPQLVIATTANINVDRTVPAGHRRFCLAFDPEQVTLRGDPRDDEPPVEAKTTDYEHLLGHTRFTLFDIVAISGAAFSPLMGAATRGAYRILLTLTNLRLGVWMPHPTVVSRARWYAEVNMGHTWRARRIWLLLLWYVLPHPFWRRDPEKQEKREDELWAHVLKLREDSTEGEGRLPLILARLQAAVCWRVMQPTLGLLWAEAAGRTSYRATWVNVTGGGDYDDLGLVEALRRGAKNVVVLDASGHEAGRWTALGKVKTLADADAGVKVELDITTMHGERADLAPGQVLRAWAVGTFTRAGGGAGDGHPPAAGNILVCKLGWWTGGSWDLNYAKDHPTYWSDSTREQLYDAAEFNIYQQLGEASVLAAAQGCTPSLPLLSPSRP
jgi:hypothetical protein